MSGEVVEKRLGEVFERKKLGERFSGRCTVLIFDPMNLKVCEDSIGDYHIFLLII